MAWVRCKYCGRPIRKFLVGWLHLNDGYPGVPTTTHIAVPWSQSEGADRIENLEELVNAAEAFVTQEGFGKDAVALPVDEQGNERPEILAKWTANAPLAVAATKRALNQVAAGALNMEELQAARKMCSASEDHREGLKAWLGRTLGDGLTALHDRVPEELRGTYAGLATPAVTDLIAGRLDAASIGAAAGALPAWKARRPSPPATARAGPSYSCSPRARPAIIAAPPSCCLNSPTARPNSSPTAAMTAPSSATP